MSADREHEPWSTDAMEAFVAYVEWPVVDADEALLALIDGAWPSDDDAFCSSLTTSGVQLSFDLIAESYEAAADLAVERARRAQSVLEGRPTKVTVCTEHGQFVADVGST